MPIRKKATKIYSVKALDNLIRSYENFAIGFGDGLVDLVRGIFTGWEGSCENRTQSSSTMSIVPEGIEVGAEPDISIITRDEQSMGSDVFLGIEEESKVESIVEGTDSSVETNLSDQAICGYEESQHSDSPSVNSEESWVSFVAGDNVFQEQVTQPQVTQPQVSSYKRVDMAGRVLESPDNINRINRKFLSDLISSHEKDGYSKVAELNLEYRGLSITPKSKGKVKNKGVCINPEQFVGVFIR